MSCMDFHVQWDFTAQIANHIAFCVNFLNMPGNKRFQKLFLAVRTFDACVFLCNVFVEQLPRVKTVHALSIITFELSDVVYFFDVTIKTTRCQEMQLTRFTSELEKFEQKKNKFYLMRWVVESIELLKCARCIFTSAGVFRLSSFRCFISFITGNRHAENFIPYWLLTRFLFELIITTLDLSVSLICSLLVFLSSFSTLFCASVVFRLCLPHSVLRSWHSVAQENPQYPYRKFHGRNSLHNRLYILKELIF